MRRRLKRRRYLNLRFGGRPDRSPLQCSNALNTLLNNAVKLEEAFEALEEKNRQDQEPNRTEFSDDDNAPEAPPRPTEILDHPARFKTVACGRRWGKSALGITAILQAAHLEHKRCWWVTPTYQQAEDVWLELVDTVEHLKGVK